MISLSLKEFAMAVGAEPKWVLSAATRLGGRFDYTEAEARWLRLARALNRDLRIPLPFAATLARGAIHETATGEATQEAAQAASGEAASDEAAIDDGARTSGVAWLAGSKGDGLGLVLDLARCESTFQAALAAAKAFGAPRRAGRKPRPPAHYRAALARAHRRGINIGGLRGTMRLPVETRLGGRLPWEIRNADPGHSGTPGAGNPRAAGDSLAWPGAKVVEILRHLQQEGVRGVIIGELAEVVRGASRDEPEPCVELCYESSPPNLRRLARALRRVAARAAPGGCVPDGVTLRVVRNLALTTRFGPLILRAKVPGLGDFAHAERRGDIMHVLELDARVLDVEALRVARYASGTRADMERLPVLDTLIAIPPMEARRREVADQRKRWWTGT